MKSFFILNKYSFVEKIFENLERKRKKQIFFLIFLMLIVAIAEMFSVAMVIPLLVTISDSSKYVLQHYGLGIIVRIFTSFFGDSNTLPVASIIFIFLILISSTIRILYLWYSGKISALITLDISKKVYRKVLYQPYLNFLKRDKSEYLNLLINQLNQISPVINFIFIIIANFLVITILVLTLLLIDHKVTLASIFLLGVVYYFLISRSKKVLYSIGLRTNNLQRELQRIFQNDIGGIKDILMNNKQKNSIKKFLEIEKPIRDNQYKSLFLISFPRYAFESLIISGMLLITYLVITFRSGSATVIPVMGSICLASLKILPSLQTIFAAIGSIETKQKQIKVVMEILDYSYFNYSKIENLKNIKKLDFKNSIILKNVAFNYGQNEAFNLEKINLKILKNQIIGICGSNGSGKSTLIEIIMGLLQPISGQVLIDGNDLYNFDFEYIFRYRQLISYVSQTPFLGEKTILENITYEKDLRNVDFLFLDYILQEVEMNEFISKLPKGLESNINESSFSGGQKQKIALARALYKKTPILILDEVTNNLDVSSQKNLKRIIKKLKNNITIILISHKENFINYCDNIYVIEDGIIKNTFNK